MKCQKTETADTPAPTDRIKCSKTTRRKISDIQDKWTNKIEHRKKDKWKKKTGKSFIASLKRFAYNP